MPHASHRSTSARLLILCTALLLPVAATAVPDPDLDQLGIWFDAEATQNCLPGGPPPFTPLNVYVILSNPTAPVCYFEFCYEIVPYTNLLRTGEWMPAGLLLVPTIPAGDCLGYPITSGLPVAPHLILIHWTFLAAGPVPPTDFYLRGLPVPSIPGDLPVVGCAGAWRQVGVTSGDPDLPVASMGSANCPVGEQVSSFGTIKGLFR